MEIVDQAGWDECRKNNSEGYGKAVVDYAEAWANLMEKKMAAGEKLEAMWESASHEADTEGITGFMYGAAVSILTHAWKHGKELAKWHNRKYVKDEAKADVAAEMGRTVNPAILVIGGEEEEKGEPN